MLSITSLDYEENYFDETLKQKVCWKLDGLKLSQFTVLTGVNGAGKTRSCNVITNTIKSIISRVGLQLGNKHLVVNTAENMSFELVINVEQDESYKPFLKEEKLFQIINDEKKLLFDRDRIYDSNTSQLIQYRPPENALTFHVRRDMVSHPFIEDIFKSLNKYHFLDFEEPKALALGKIIGEHLPLEILPSMTPMCFEQFVTNEKKKTILDQINYVGFSIKDIFVMPTNILTKDGFKKVPMLYLKEENITAPYNIMQASSGMMKVIFLIVTLNLIEKESCILIDNIGDGLDYKRSIEAMRILEEKSKESQIIVSTNNEFLLNQTDIRNWNILHRNGPVVKAYNYVNNKDKLIKFSDSGLSNYEYFKEEYYLEGPK